MKIIDAIKGDYQAAKNKNFLMVKYALEKIINHIKKEKMVEDDDVSAIIESLIHEKTERIDKYIKKNMESSVLETEIHEREILRSYIRNYEKGKTNYIYKDF